MLCTSSMFLSLILLVTLSAVCFHTVKCHLLVMDCCKSLLNVNKVVIFLQ